MKKIIIITLIIFAFAFSSSSQQSRKPTLARFVAFDKFSGWKNPREPIQTLIIEIQKSKVELLKILYFPKTNGFRGGAKILETDTLNYKNLWRMKLRDPSENEKLNCETDNFLRTFDGEIDTNEKNEPTLRFRSTQIDADVKLNNLSEMPCQVLDSFSK
jgi:hypothetical protein